VTDADNAELEPAAPDDEVEAVIDREPDVLLDVPDLGVDEITLEVEDLRARVSLQADVLDLLKLHVGVDAELGRVKLTIKGVEAKLLLKARLDNVARIVDRVMTTIDNNPDLVETLLEVIPETVEEAGAVAGEAVGGVVGEAGREVGKVLEDVTEGAGKVVGGLAGKARPRAPAPAPPPRRRPPAADPAATRRAKGPRTSRDRRSEGG
jgi:hypothetical protein